MSSETTGTTSYFELSKHSTVQFIVFGILVALTGYIIQMFIVTPTVEVFFEKFLHAHVVRDGSSVKYKVSGANRLELTATDAYYRWAILIDDAPTGRPGETLEAEYIFSPIISLAPVVIAFSFGFAAFFTTLLPQKMGLLRQKIEREVVNSLDKIARALYGEHTDAELREIVDALKTADARELHDYADGIGMPYNDVETLRRAALWREYGLFGQIIHAHDGIKFYMRQYFTVQYSNAVLGLVYIGAALLIIIIGIRGLKFIPPSEPSVILFALGLEFILLVTYAVMLLYSKQEDNSGDELTSAGSGDMFGSTGGVQGGEDAENLLRAFASRPR
ncbi:hypothetical protein MASR2M18_00860 [Ignavibacteria bacterium]|nr:hypothetical protein [Bacteroidota bacterium]MCZ2132186.1 hypothetical protein [Bacteroidota bacterium]